MRPLIKLELAINNVKRRALTFMGLSIFDVQLNRL